MTEQVQIYLDVETDWGRRLTLVGFRSGPTGLVQLVGAEITTERLHGELPRDGILYTYNGHCFDLPVIRDQLGLDLRARFVSRDLRWICQGCGITGGQKAIEERIGVRRQLAGLGGLDANALWGRYQRGDREALETLLGYNREDLDGLVAIRDHLHGRRILTALDFFLQSGVENVEAHRDLPACIGTDAGHEESGAGTPALGGHARRTGDVVLRHIHRHHDEPARLEPTRACDSGWQGEHGRLLEDGSPGPNGQRSHCTVRGSNRAQD
jgi:hypothetical protein